LGAKLARAASSVKPQAVTLPNIRT
jgi:hypothetical protein